MDDFSVVTAAREGSEDAFASLYKQHLPYVKAVGRSILRSNDLDDFCQDTFLQAFTRIDSFQGTSTFRTWLTRIAMNQCLMILRHNRQITNGASQLMQFDGDTVADDVMDKYVFTADDMDLRAVAARLDLPKMLRMLKPDQQRMLEMAYIDEMPDQQIADTFGVTLAAVKGKLHQAKKKLRVVYSKM